MLKSKCLIVSFLAYSTITLASPSAVNCEKSSQFSTNIHELSSVANSSDICPEPSKNDFELVCDNVYTKKVSGDETELNYKYQETLWKMSCARDGSDSLEEARKKIQLMWNKYRTSFSCNYPGLKVPQGNVTKMSVDTGFTTFLMDAVKEYKLDMNFKDPIDGKTVLDFINEEIANLKRSSVDLSFKIKEYESLYKLLQANGAKHSRDL
jgi:hypothetical protein